MCSSTPPNAANICLLNPGRGRSAAAAGSELAWGNVYSTVCRTVRQAMPMHLLRWQRRLDVKNLRKLRQNVSHLKIQPMTRAAAIGPIFAAMKVRCGPVSGVTALLVLALRALLPANQAYGVSTRIPK